jgi:murein DD-endopeptidase MepM/ murein hydrolase activator NlpD
MCIRWCRARDADNRSAAWGLAACALLGVACAATALGQPQLQSPPQSPPMPKADATSELAPTPTAPRAGDDGSKPSVSVDGSEHEPDDDSEPDPEVAVQDPARPSRNCGRGPRRVPTPKGAALRRAQRLGLGSHKTGAHLLGKPPESRWVRAASGRRPRTLLWPVAKGKFSRGFGMTRQNKPHLAHLGVDILAPLGSPVRAAADGLVAYSDNGLCGYGNVVLLVHNNGWVTLYAHNDRVLVQAGSRVRRGDVLAHVGATGLARGNHLHFELHERGKARDPALLFRGPGAPPRNVLNAKSDPRARATRGRNAKKKAKTTTRTRSSSKPKKRSDPKS